MFQDYALSPSALTRALMTAALPAPQVTPRRGKPGHLKGGGLSMQSTVNSSIGELTWSLDSNRTWRCSTK